jgi:hypothetical protein
MKEAKRYNLKDWVAIQGNLTKEYPKMSDVEEPDYSDLCLLN